MSDKLTTSVALVLSNCILKGDFPTHGMRVVDVLNDHNTRFVQIDNAGIFQRDDSSPITSVAATSVIKDNIQMALLADESKPSDRKPFFATLEKRTVDVVVTLPASVVEGHVHLKSAGEPQTYLSIEAGAFIPVVDGTIHHFSKTVARLKSHVVLINKTSISSIAFTS